MRATIRLTDVPWSAAISESVSPGRTTYSIISGTPARSMPPAVVEAVSRSREPREPRGPGRREASRRRSPDLRTVGGCWESWEFTGVGPFVCRSADARSTTTHGEPERTPRGPLTPCDGW